MQNFQALCPQPPDFRASGDWGLCPKMGGTRSRWGGHGLLPSVATALPRIFYTTVGAGAKINQGHINAIMFREQRTKKP